MTFMKTAKMVIGMMAIFIVGTRTCPLYAQSESDPKWTVFLQGGISNRLMGIPQDVPKFYSDAASSAAWGYQGQLTVAYTPGFFPMPMGVTVHGFHASGNRSAAEVNTNMFFAGFTWRFFARELGRHQMSLFFGPGCIFYENKRTLADKITSTEGTAFGLNATFHYGYMLSKMIGVGMSVSGTDGFLRKAVVTEAGESHTVQVDGREDAESLMHTCLSFSVELFF